MNTKIKFFILFLIIAQYSFSQQDTLSKKFLNEDLTLDVNLLQLQNLPSTASMEYKSTEINATAYLFITGKEKNVSIALGITADAFNIYSNFGISKDSTGNPVLQNISDTVSYAKNKIGISSVGVPIEIRLKTNKNLRGKNFKFTIGAQMGYVLSTYRKYKGDDIFFLSKDKIKIKTYGLPGINKITGNLYIKAYYDKFGINFRYFVTPVFDTNNNLKNISMFSVGLSFIIF